MVYSTSWDQTKRANTPASNADQYILIRNKKNWAVFDKQGLGQASANPWFPCGDKNFEASPQLVAGEALPVLTDTSLLVL